MSKLRFDVISIFPDYLSPLKLSLIGKAQENNLIDITVHDLRDKAHGVHKSVDDTPYGGGAGMVMSPEPWGEMIDEVIAASNAKIHDLIILTPAGQKLTQKLAEELSTTEHMIFACGRYEGIDDRVRQYYEMLPNVRVRELSIGDYVLGGGEVATLVTMEAVIRLIPGVLGNPDSLVEESHSLPDEMVEYPNYTKPVTWRGIEVPEVLLSGNHALIERWRSQRAAQRTKEIQEATGQ